MTLSPAVAVTSRHPPPRSRSQLARWRAMSSCRRTGRPASWVAEAIRQAATKNDAALIPKATVGDDQ